MNTNDKFKLISSQSWKKFELQKILNTVLPIILFSFFVYKCRMVIQDPRLFWEEGTTYLFDAFKNGFFSIFTTHQGYYSIIPNLVIYVSTFFNSKYIPYFTVYASFLFFLLLFYEVFIYINKQKISILFQILYLLSFYLIIIIEQDVLLSTINLQFFTPLIIYFIIKNNESLSYLNKFILIICLLNGTLGIFLRLFYFINIIQIIRNFLYSFF